MISESTASGLKCSASLFLQSKEHTPVKDAKIRGTRVRSKKKKRSLPLPQSNIDFSCSVKATGTIVGKKMQHFFFPPVLLKMSHTNIRGFYSRKKKGFKQAAVDKKTGLIF